MQQLHFLTFTTLIKEMSDLKQSNKLGGYFWYSGLMKLKFLSFFSLDNIVCWHNEFLPTTKVTRPLLQASHWADGHECNHETTTTVKRILVFPNAVIYI